MNPIVAIDIAIAVSDRALKAAHAQRAVITALLAMIEAWS